MRQTAMDWGIPVYSHEVGMQPMSAFFTDKEATAYPVEVDEDMALDDEQEKMLHQVLEKRSKGEFETAGVGFWPEMHELKDSLKEKLDKFEYIVPIFTNVIFDTSQSHANVLFNNMFEWLDLVLANTEKFPKTLFVIRAHPDESRPGKESMESVKLWVEENGIAEIDNVIFIPPDEYISSYELVRRAKFVLVYNSTIGLEASIFGKSVLCAAKARYTQIPTVFLPESEKDYKKMLTKFLKQKVVKQLNNHRENAKRVFFSQYFIASLPFNEFLEDDSVWRGYVRIKDFKPKALSPDRSQMMKVILDGIIEGKPFTQDL